MSTAYHPETDGQSERTNRCIEDILRHYVNAHKTDWEQWLPTAEFAYNSAVNSSTGYTPFQAVYGENPRQPLDVFSDAFMVHTRTSAVPAVESLLMRHQTILHDLQHNIKRAQERMTSNANKTRRPHEEYLVGDLSSSPHRT